MIGEPSELLSVARANLDTARRDLDAGAPMLAVSRAYHASFHTASAALSTEGVDPWSHKGTHTPFARVFLRDERLPGSLGSTMAGRFQLRLDADDHVGAVISLTEARDAVADDTDFADWIDEWLSGQRDSALDTPTDDHP